MRKNTFTQVCDLLNSGKINEDLLNSRLHLLSKNGTPKASLDDIRPLMIESHWLKLIEKAILNKADKLNSTLLHTLQYQSGFK